MRKGIQAVLISAILFAFYYFGFDYFGKTAGTVVSVFSTLTVVSIGFMIFMENRHPSATMAWILLLALIPVVGLVFYWLFGQNYFKRRKYDKKAQRDIMAYESEALQRSTPDLSSFKPDHRQILQLSQRLARTPISFSTETKVLTNGEETFSALLPELRKARHHIHMEYYIYRSDEIGTEIKNILIQKAREGVSVRFIVDAVGSLQLPPSFLNEMQEAGVRTAVFGSPRTIFFTSRVNYRNHRKIVVIDGSVGFMGGLNIGDEYLSRNKTYGFWRDTHMLVKGEAVRTLQVIFMQDWQYVTDEVMTEQEYYSPELLESQRGAVQIIASGPDNERRALKHIFFSMIVSAKKSVWLATPYFIPDDDILTALRVAALSGLDVRILFPAKPDKWLPFLASHSYFPTLLDAGVEIFEYERGFLHSKLLIVDGEIATIGTANMDMRSFHLNFEVNALLVETESVLQMVHDFERDLQFATLIDQDKFMNKPIIFRLLESGARLMSPLL
ncbi:cardiolipin synthase [Paenibacillus sp. DMB20]|uniref:cardiolipin synthase n=1 Tax=Paenibacillus sp. DMB20 TaxID=1642570 RepID=UPI0006274C03|nr:cardiolipin synthase [Paenibacillus sp. DMB20]KKO54733.1 cardiolipin synthetase [Paenibacillus sp. DMB20]